MTFTCVVATSTFNVECVIRWAFIGIAMSVLLTLSNKIAQDRYSLAKQELTCHSHGLLLANMAML